MSASKRGANGIITTEIDMFILRRNHDNEVVCEQAQCPTPEQIVVATRAGMTWRCNANGDWPGFMQATERALMLLGAANSIEVTICQIGGPANKLMIPKQYARGHIIKHCGIYYVREGEDGRSPFFVETDLYDTGIG